MTTAALLQEEQENQHNTVFGFWVYLMSDCILFGMLFAAFIVLKHNTFGGPSISDVATLPYIFTETLFLLTSSFTCGLAMLSRLQNKKNHLLFWLLITLILGAAFIGMELKEFLHLIHEGNGWQRSGALSAFFVLVGTHGLHVTIGLIWIMTMIAQVYIDGISNTTTTKLNCLALFWHFLDIVWIFVFSIVYLL